MNWSYVFCTFGVALTKPSLTMQLMIGVDVFAHVCGQKTNTSTNYCDNIQPYDKRRFSFCQIWHVFSLFLLEITANSNFQFSQGNAETYWRYGGTCYMSFVGNLLLFQAVKEFWKSAKNWQSYRHEFGVLLFWDTVYWTLLRFVPEK